MPRRTAAREAAALSEGCSGPNVVKLQKRLKELGFNPGLCDGDFGPATTAALIAFQKSENLLADGVAGPRTQTALELVDDPALPSAIAGVTVTAVSRMFPHTPVDNIRANLPFVIDGLVSKELVDRPMVLMALATIRAETEGFEPICEGRSKFNTSPGGHPFDLYDNRRDLGNRGAGDGDRFKGRGFIQLTGRTNYLRFGKVIGRSLVTDPELANEPSIAALVLACFLKDKERRIKEALLDRDLRLARKLVNGGSHGLDRFTETFEIGERVLAGG